MANECERTDTPVFSSVIGSCQAAKNYSKPLVEDCLPNNLATLSHKEGCKNSFSCKYGLPFSKKMKNPVGNP